jgi:sulfite reductase alpha subunit-like flavoprotein
MLLLIFKPYLLSRMSFSSKLKDQGSRMTVSNILEAFPDIRISLLDLIRLVPKLRPRFYSISSSAAVHPFEIHLTIAVKGHRRAVNNKEMLDFGVASGYLYSLSESNTNSDTAIISIQSTGFHLPSSPLTPIIMISAGAGIAPFRAFAQERANLKAQG